MGDRSQGLAPRPPAEQPADLEDIQQQGRLLEKSSSRTPYEFEGPKKLLIASPAQSTIACSPGCRAGNVYRLFLETHLFKTEDASARQHNPFAFPSRPFYQDLESRELQEKVEVSHHYSLMSAKIHSAFDSPR